MTMGTWNTCMPATLRQPCTRAHTRIHTLVHTHKNHDIKYHIVSLRRSQSQKKKLLTITNNTLHSQYDDIIPADSNFCLHEWVKVWLCFHSMYIDYGSLINNPFLLFGIKLQKLGCDTFSNYRAISICW